MRLVLMLLGAGLGGVAVADPAVASPFPPTVHGRTVCARAFVRDVGWQSWRCASRGGALYVGTTGQGRPMEAVSVWTAGTGGVCLAGRVRGAGWTADRCTGERGEVTIRGRALEAVRVSTRTGICVRGYAKPLGWQAWRCAAAAHPAKADLGTGRRLEALRLTV